MGGFVVVGWSIDVNCQDTFGPADTILKLPTIFLFIELKLQESMVRGMNDSSLHSSSSSRSCQETSRQLIQRLHQVAAGDERNASHMHIMKLHEPPNIFEPSIFIKVIQFFLACLYYMYIRPFFIRNHHPFTRTGQAPLARSWRSPGCLGAQWIGSIYIYIRVSCLQTTSLS